MLARLNAAGVQVWLPEAGGPVELDSPVHQALMVLLGAQAQREVARARRRVMAAMRAQTRLQGRFWVVARRTGTAWSTAARIPTPCTPGGAGGSMYSSRIR